MFDSFFNNNTGECLNITVQPSCQIIQLGEVSHA
jgi:hypothetical protein